MRLFGYLSRIKQGLAINYDAFLRRLPPEVSGRHRQYFETRKVGPKNWLVRCVDPAVWRRLEEAAKKPSDRVSAARLGDSHRHRTEAAFLLVYHADLPDERPDVVYLTEGKHVQGFVSNPNVLLVENEENFFRPQEMLDLASRLRGEPLSLANTDVVLGSGNRVTRELCVNWLDHYETVLCAFDYDRGGLGMFSSVRRRLGDKAVYLQPQSWGRYHAAFRRTPDSTEAYREAIGLAERLGFVELARAFLETGRFMEQEVLLETQDE